MQRYRRRRQQNNTFTLFITTFLGGCIGFSMCFALFMAGVFDSFLTGKSAEDEENRVRVAERDAEPLTPTESPVHVKPSTPVAFAGESVAPPPDAGRLIEARGDKGESEPKEEGTLGLPEVEGEETLVLTDTVTPGEEPAGTPVLTDAPQLDEESEGTSVLTEVSTSGEEPEETPALTDASKLDEEPEEALETLASKDALQSVVAASENDSEGEGDVEVGDGKELGEEEEGEEAPGNEIDGGLEVLAAAADGGTVIEDAEAVEATWGGRHLFISVKGPSLDDAARAFLREVRPGGVVLGRDNVVDKAQTTRLVQDIKDAVGVEGLPLIAADQEGGRINRLQLANTPRAVDLGRAGDAYAAWRTGLRYGRACAERGIALALAPVLDVYSQDTDFQNMRSRCFSEDRKVVSEMGLAFADGLLAGGVLPIAKHYPGYAGAKRVHGMAVPVLDRDAAGLAQTLYPFNRAAEQGIPGIMAAHISVPLLDGATGAIPAALSSTLVDGVMRKRWGYEGVILTDDIKFFEGTNSFSMPDAAVKALGAGCDAVLFLRAEPEAVLAVCAAIETARQAGVLSAVGLARSKARLDALPGLLRAGYRLADAQFEADAVVVEATVVETVVPTSQARTKLVYHSVERGDTLGQIAQHYGVTQQNIVDWNNMASRKVLLGARLKIHAPEVKPVNPYDRYVIKAGDTLKGIALAHNISSQELMRINGITNPDIVKLGTKLRVPKQ